MEAGEEGEEEAGRKREKGENSFSKDLISFPAISLFTFYQAIRSVFSKPNAWLCFAIYSVIF